MSAAPPPPETPKLYLTPQLQKRRDGLAPALLDPQKEVILEDKTSLTRSYRTSSHFLRVSVLKGDGDDGCGVDDSKELQNIVDSIQHTVKTLDKKDVSRVQFFPQGCMWQLSLPVPQYHIRVGCSACSEEGGSGGNTYVVETTLVPPNNGGGGGNNNHQHEPAFKDAKAIFDSVVLYIRKAAVSCEFPEFPEGCKGTAFRDIYQLNARLKSGSFATVCRGTHRASGKKVAIKCVLRKDLPPSDDAAIYDEVAILASLDHPYIVPLIDFFEEKDCYFIVMELMSGGDLFDRIGKKKAYSEADARDLCSKMLKAMAYCHTKNIAHCDMKPKNLLLTSDDNDSYIKLADFGFAARVHSPKSLTKQCGTPFFVSPEILMRQSYDQKSDMWSVGCIVYLLLSGNLPFMGRSQKELFRKIVVGKYEMDEDCWSGVSDEARDLVSKMLVTDPDKRISAADSLRHRWLQQDNKRLSLINLAGTSQRLKTFNARMKLRSAMIAIDWVSTLKRTSFVKSFIDKSDTNKELNRLKMAQSIKEEE